MNKQLVSALKSMSEMDYILLGQYRHAAEMCRNIQSKYSITDENMMGLLGLCKLKFSHFKKGAYEYTLMDFANLESISMTFAADAQKLKIKSESLSFPDFKDSKPLVYEQINDILKTVTELSATLKTSQK